MAQQKTSKTAIHRVADYLAKRDHSIRELVQKLKKWHTPDEIQVAMEHAIQHGWILEPDQLALKVSRQLDQKSRGTLYINTYLKRKGLPPVTADVENEAEKARWIAKKKFTDGPPYTFEQKKVIYRLLVNRGFTDEICRKIMNETSLGE